MCRRRVAGPIGAPSWLRPSSERVLHELRQSLSQFRMQRTTRGVSLFIENKKAPLLPPPRRPQLCPCCSPAPRGFHKPPLWQDALFSDLLSAGGAHKLRLTQRTRVPLCCVEWVSAARNSSTRFLTPQPLCCSLQQCTTLTPQRRCSHRQFSLRQELVRCTQPGADAETPHWRWWCVRPP